MRHHFSLVSFFSAGFDPAIAVSSPVLKVPQLKFYLTVRAGRLSVEVATDEGNGRPDLGKCFELKHL